MGKKKEIEFNIPAMRLNRDDNLKLKKKFRARLVKKEKDLALTSLLYGI